MNAERWRKISELYNEALVREGKKRAAFLAQACAGDDALRREVEWLLDTLATTGSVLSAPPLTTAATLVAKMHSGSVEGPAGSTWGHFTLLERIGAGGFGEVYRATDTKLDREVALKLLFVPRAREARSVAHVLKEARLLARLRHPNVVTVYGADEIKDQVGIWMEFVHGQTLDNLVRTRGPFGAREAALIGLDLCAALAAVHAAGLLHGDVKAHNVVREDGGRTVLMDFGAAKDLRPGVVASAEGLVGTLRYLAPEVFGGAPRTAALDIYALGVLLYYLVSGCYPVDGQTFEAVIEAHRRSVRRQLRDARADLPDRFVRIVERAIASEPHERFASAGVLEVELSTFLRGLAAHAEVARATAAVLLDHTERDRRTAHLGLRPAACFVGREDDLRRLHEELNGSSASGLTVGRAVAITALGGTGKTTLARMYAECYWAGYEQLLWVDARRGYESEFARLCEVVLPDTTANLSEIPDRDKARRVLSELENLEGARLLVIDNAEDEASTTPWLPKTGGVRTLITSRYAHWEAIPTRPLTVLAPSAATNLLLSRSGRIEANAGADNERAACEELAERLGYLPLALEQAAAYIRKQSPGFGFQSYLRLFGDAQKEMLSLPVRGTTEYPSSVFMTWRTTIDKLPAGARVMLRCAAFLAPTEIPLGVFHDSAKELSALEPEFPTGEPSDASASAEFRVRAWRQALAEYSLITLTAGDTFAIHPLLQAVERDQVDSAARKRWIVSVMDALVKHAPPDPDQVEHWPGWRLLAAHAAALSSRGREVGLQHANTKLLRSLCMFHAEQGRFADALVWGREAMEQDEALLGPTHPDTLSSKYSLAVALALQGNAEAAEPLFRHVLSGREQVFGPRARDTIRALQWLGNVLSWQGKQIDAEPLQERALAAFERLDPDSPDTLWSLWSLGRSRVDDHAGEPLLRRAVAAQERLHGPNHVETLVHAVSLSHCLTQQGKYAEAEVLARRAATGLERIAGPGYRWTWYAMHNLADCVMRRGDHSSAEPIARGALELGRHSGNEWDTWRFTRTLARILEQQERCDEAEPLYRRILEGMEGRLGTVDRRAQSAREDWERCRRRVG